MNRLPEICLIIMAAAFIGGMFAAIYYVEKNKSDFNMACIQAGKSLIGGSCVRVSP